MSWKKTKLSEEHKYLYLAFLLGFGIFAVSVLPFVISTKGIFIFYGDYNVQQLPFYTMAHEAVRNGAAGYNFNIDLGGSLISCLSFYLMGSPFFWLTIPFSKEFIPYLLPWLLALKCAFASLFAYVYIKKYVTNKNLALLGALLYAFSGFQGSTLVFNHFQDVTAFFPLYLYLFEKCAEDKKRIKFALMTAFMAILNYYFFFGQVVFLLIYFFIKYCDFKKFGQTMRSFGRVLFEGMAGFMLSAVYFLPAISETIHNNRISQRLEGWDLLLYPDFQVWLSIIKNTFMMSDQINIGTVFFSETTALSSPAAYLPLFSLVGVIAFALAKRKHWATRTVCVFAVIAAVPVLNALFSALNTQYYARWFYMILLIMAMMTAKSLEDVEWNYLKIGVLVVTGVQLLLGVFEVIVLKTSLAEIFYPIGTTAPALWLQVYTMILSLPLLYYLIFLNRGKKTIPSKNFSRNALICTVIACTGCFIGYIAVGSSQVSLEGRQIFIDETLSGNQFESFMDSNFNRIETDKSSMNYAMLWNKESIGDFISTTSSSATDFLHSMGIERKVISFINYDKIGMRALLCVKYYLEDMTLQGERLFENGGGIEGYEYLCTENGYNIYRNTNVLPMGVAYDYYIPQEVFDKLDDNQKDKMILGAVVLSAQQEQKLATKLKPCNLDLILSATYKDLSIQRKEEACENFVVEGNTFYADCNLSKEQMVLFTIPYSKGFEVTVDDRQVEEECVNSGLLGFLVPKGEHKIVIKYHQPGAKEGFAVSVIGLLILGLYSGLFLWKAKSKADVKK